MASATAIRMRLGALATRLTARRRALFTVTLVVVSALVAGAHDERADAASSDIVLLYVGAQDCAPCRRWQDEDGARFRQSREFRRITYQEVKSATLFDLLKDETWPEDLRPYRERLGRGAAVPMWLIMAGDEVVSREYGASQWRRAVLPTLRSLLRRAG